MVHHPVTRYGRLAAEARRDDLDSPVRAAAGARAGMSGVLRALVDEIERDRLERRAALPEAPGNLHSLSSTYPARDRACATRKTRLLPLPPDSLQATHTSGGLL